MNKKKYWGGTGKKNKAPKKKIPSSLRATFSHVEGTWQIQRSMVVLLEALSAGACPLGFELIIAEHVTLLS